MLPAYLPACLPACLFFFLLWSVACYNIAVVSLLHWQPIQHKPPTAQKKLCIWGTDNLDGQKSIWLQQMKHLNQVTETCVMPLKRSG
jgi:hypothetical protein